ncbi:LuxR C-terminal-related transcriptional regulator [Dyella sp. C9]|uniref:LuxR C-terminal-related transcriptional regulator n=1 Tax=Dyella sp. C9 TaxID=2202154 RepID=UPI000DEED04E|nr:LuxR C-terminal-related transcriptional regulator [Dyella sp. C9]
MDRRVLVPLLDALYAMPQVDADWSPFLGLLGDAFRAHAVAFQTHDVLHQHGQIDTCVGMPTDLLPRYRELSNEHPWYIRGGERLYREGMADDEGLLTPAELYDSRFYGELMEPAHVAHGMALCLHNEGPDRIAHLTINREGREGYYNDDERALGRALLPHLRGAYLLQQRMGWLEADVRTFRSALDRLDEGVVLLDRQGRVRHCNTSAEGMAAEGLFTRQPDGALRLPTLQQTLVMRHYIFACSPALEPVSMRIVDARGRWVGVAKLCPVERMVSLSWSEADTGVVVFFSRASQDQPLPHRDHWRSLWKLTRAEADLAQCLANGQTLAQAADVCGVSKNTVRTQLRGVLAKTGVGRQAELVRLLVLSRP